MKPINEQTAELLNRLKKELLIIEDNNKYNIAVHELCEVSTKLHYIISLLTEQELTNKAKEYN